MRVGHKSQVGSMESECVRLGLKRDRKNKDV